MWIFYVGNWWAKVGVEKRAQFNAVFPALTACERRPFSFSRGQNAALWAANFRPIINNKKARLKTLLFSFTGRLFCCNLTDCLKKFQLHQSFLMAHLRSILMLLPSGPDMVRRDKLHKTLISSSKVFAHIRPNYP